MENIVINVDFQSRDLSSIFANEVQVVPGDIAWEDLELMVCNVNDVARELRLRNCWILLTAENGLRSIICVRFLHIKS